MKNNIDVLPDKQDSVRSGCIADTDVETQTLRSCTVCESRVIASESTPTWLGRIGIQL